MKTKKFYTPFKKGKDHILYGKESWNHGKKMPHSKEWEEKRLKAIRESAKNKIYPRGYHRPESATKSMREALKKWQKENPKLKREIAIKNLSKNHSLDLSGSNSPMWEGGITQEWQKWKSSHGKQLDEWRKKIYERDGNKCKLCGSGKKLEAHHIIPISECRDTAFLEMNGVLLCHECHKKTDSFGGKTSKKKKMETSGKFMCIGLSIPHKFQAYETVGNYEWTESGTLVIFVSEMGNEDYEHLVFLHEFVEASLCKARGISCEEITAFDIEFEKNRAEGNVDEPGNDPKAPYRLEHNIATFIESGMAQALGVDFNKYDDTVNNL
jgi:hypothetical protein